MNCSECGGDTFVINSRQSKTPRSTDIPKRYSTYKNLTYRSIKCSDCDLTARTIELNTIDFDGLINTLKQQFIDEVQKTIK